jgi:NTE family protein
MGAPQFTHISFSGGGMLGMSYLGVIHYLQLEKHVDNIRFVSGASIGSMFALVLALNVPCDKVLEYITKHIATEDFFKIDGKRLLDIIDHKGVDDGERFITPLRWMLQDVFDTSDVSFLEFTKKTGRDLVICATCIESGDPFYFSVNTTPTVHVLDAIRASIAIPLLAKPVQINGQHFVDGGIVRNHPVDVFGNPPPVSCLAIKCTSPMKQIQTMPENIFAYVVRLMDAMFLHYDRDFNRCRHYILLDQNPIPFFKAEYKKPNIILTMTQEDVENALYYGFHKTYEFFKNLSG